MTCPPTYVDRSARPVLQLAGAEALDLLQRISTNDLRSLKVGEAAGTILTTEKGRIRDVLTVVRTAEAELLLFGTISASAELADWIGRFVIMEDVTVGDVTEEFSRFHLLWAAPELKADGGLKTVRLSPAPEETAWLMPEPASGGRALALVARRDLEGHARRFLQKEGFQQGDDASVTDFCVYYGVPVPGVELTDEVNPHEAGLIGLVSSTKGCYVGQEVIARLDTYKKVQRQLASFTLSRKPARVPIQLVSGSQGVGELSSAVYSDELGSWIGLASVKPAFLEGSASAEYEGDGEKGVATLRTAPQH